MLIKWTENQRDEFASQWPCCAVPATGFAEWDSNGDLVDLSDNCRVKPWHSGLVEFLADLYLKPWLAS